MERRDIDLDGLFAAAKATPAPVSADLLSRVMEDALDAQLVNAATPPLPAHVQDHKIARFWRGVVEAIGGWPAVAGLATASVAGVWIGFSPALGVGDAMAGVIGTTSAASGDTYFVDLMPEYDFDLGEGDAG